ncbi:hypothetical protein [Muribaculum sp.]|uniref:hypothetical protein n=1 Tax=Muribaculum sp. TaxID=1918611 RepID=UPI000F488F4F|nr:hypothetical protein [Muribaculum sp.]MCX4279203.1 hypothetical protein [Muribaculum sp.]ROS85152.1 hypothetical protein EEK90_03135 [Muribaculaceae bacterium Isolate-036 (Harlan)]ROS92357.1 hypothetical protein EEL36_09025 [Muribaculaceae bacterium Isolate-043 (Harlan)]
MKLKDNGQIAIDSADILKQNRYRFEIDTEDIVMGFAKTMKTTTRNVQKAINMIKKVCNDCGTFISPSVRIVSVRMYQNNELVKSLNA